MTSSLTDTPIRPIIGRNLFWASSLVAFLVVPVLTPALIHPFAGAPGLVILRSFGLYVEHKWSVALQSFIVSPGIYVAAMSVSGLLVTWPLLFRRNALIASSASLAATAPVFALCFIGHASDCRAGTDELGIASFSLWFAVIAIHLLRRMPLPETSWYGAICGALLGGLSPIPIALFWPLVYAGPIITLIPPIVSAIWIIASIERRHRAKAL